MPTPLQIRVRDRHPGRSAGSLRPAHLRGELDAFSPFEILEFLAILRRTGTLAVASPAGERGTVALADGQIVAAEIGHRRGEEAALTMVAWQRGSFEFSLGLAATEEFAPLSVSSVVLEAVRLEDELLRRAAFLPAPDAPLTLGRASHCPDPAGCGLEEAITRIRERPGITLAELEVEASHCPAKVRLAASLLSYCRLLDLPRAEAPSAEPRAPSTTGAACIRVLIALEAVDLARHLPLVLSSLGESLGAPSITPMASQESPAFIRFRPEGRGVVSLTFLPICREHRLLFESFGRSVDLVLLDPSSSAEARRWHEDLGESPALVSLPANDRLEAELNTHLAPWISA